MKKINKNIFLLLLIVLAQIPVFWMPVLGMKKAKTFIAIADATITQFNPTSNFGSNHDLSIAPQNYVCIKFDLTNKPSNAYKSELQLDFFLLAGDKTIRMYEISSSWDEYTITWSNAPTLGTFIGTFTVEHIDTSYRVNITSDIHYETGIWSICLVPEGNSFLTFASREYSDWFEPPKIIFHYELSDLPIIITVIVIVVIIAIAIVIGTGFIKKKKPRKKSAELVIPTIETHEQIPKEVTEGKKYCSMCLTPAPLEATYCMHCGTKFSDKESN